MQWIWRGSALAVLLIGWVFITWQNHFHITAPLVFICLGYLAVVATIYNLWRTGAAAVAVSDDENDSTWAKPAGARGELEREKRTLLKAIKEAEFDHQMGKLSQRDADDMIRTYRARAVEVLKEIDRIDLGSAGSAREQIMREVRARLEVEARSPRKAAAESRPSEKSEGKKPAGKKNPLAKDAATAAEPASTAPAAVEAAAPASAGDAAADAAADATDAASPGPDDAAASKATDAADARPPAVAASGGGASHAAAPTGLDDDAMDADSTTAAEPTRAQPAKEATP